MIYLDNNATTKTDERVIQAMIPFMSEFYANPSSSHNFGNKVKNHLENARESIASFIGAQKKNIIFTSCSTESINLAINGLALGNSTSRNKIITLATEHKAVLETYKSLQNIGYEVVILPVMSDGLVDLNEIKSSVDENTLLFSAMLVNNETGVIQPISEIAEIVRSKGSLFFCDATQAPGKIEIDIESLKVDMFCFSGHKFYGPRGIGALYLSSDIINNQMLKPILLGGGQEGGLRSGTQNVPAIIGLAEACRISMDEIKDWHNDIGKLRDLLEFELLKIVGAKVNGNTIHRVFNTTNIYFPRIDAIEMQVKLKDIYVSNSSACTSMIIEPSHVLKAMGLEENEASYSIRFSLGKENTREEIDYLTNEISKFFY